MTPLFKCFSCGQDIERSKKTFWKKKGHILCSTCQDKIEEEISLSQRNNLKRLETFQQTIS
jgi:DNA-directed RNA polymerase subunit RPC12/RpoP